MSATEWAILHGVVVVAFTVHAVTGFGSLITSLVLASFWFDFVTIQPSLVALALLLNFVFLARDGRAIPTRIVFRRVLPVMGLGALVGFGFAGLVEGPWLRRAFGAFVMLLSLRELVRASRPVALVDDHDHRVRPAWLVAAGLVHGVYATGGPMLVYALSRVPLSKTVLRVTLCAVQSVLSAGLLLGFYRRGTLDAEAAMRVVYLLPSLVVAIVVGSWIHGRIDAQRFRIVLFAVLFVAAGGMLFR